MKIRRSLALPLLLSAAGLLACGDDDAGPSGPEHMSTFEVIQQEVLDSNCVSCHTAGTAFARQSGLVLTADMAYQQLVGAAPTNLEAAEHGLLRVSAQGPGGLERSFLWEKLNAPAEEHFYGDHPGYGELMPLGRATLTNGQLEFIRRWIAAGAPREGAVVDLALLENGSRYEPEPFAPLAPPVDGLQLRMEPFGVAADFEREVFSYMPLNNAEDVYVNRFEVSMRPGSHHFILYVYPDYTPTEVIPQPYQMRDLRNEQGSYVDAAGEDVFNWQQMQYMKPILISQSRVLDFRLPEGVAMRLPPGSGIDLNAHYANVSDAPIDGEAYVNLHTIAADQVQHTARIFALANFDIYLPAGQVTTLEKEFLFTEDRQIVQLVSHAHERMVDFTAEIIGGDRDGELIYVTYDWEHPAPLRFDPPLQMAQGQGLRVRATYDNDTGQDLRFGLTRQDAEMMILYGYYYTE